MAGDVTVDDSIWQKLRARVAGLDRKFVRVGVLASKGGDAVHDDGEGGKISLVGLMAIHEFGASIKRGSTTIVIPMRAPLRRTFYVFAKDELIKMQTAIAKEIVTGGLDADKGLAMLGIWGANRVKKTITDGLEPPNALSTIAKKGSSKPLIDTGLLKNSITHEVDDGNTELASGARGGGGGV